MRLHVAIRRCALIAACVAVFASSGCTSGSNTDPVGESQGFVAGGGEATVVDPADRIPAPMIEGHTLQGDPLSLSDYKGDVVVVNVWESYCGPCRAEADTLRQVASDSRADGVRFVGINTRDQNAAAQAFERNYKVSYPSLFDPDGQLQLQFIDSLPPGAVPSTLVIDRDGRVAARVLGATEYSQLKELVADVVAEKN
ncbi:MAG TPA: TlpA disulfide reductase family protein [Actinomycetes bacterium]|nr:TlpA disulfide reductase family protein [Actinomycetes bacterium]